MRGFLCFAMLLPLFLFGTAAQAQEILEPAQLQEGLSEESLAISGKPSLDGSYDADSALGRLLQKIRQRSGERLKEELGYGLKLVALSLLCSSANALSPDKKIPVYMNLVGCCTAAMLVAGNVDSVIRQSTAAIMQLSDYSKAALPAIFTAAAAGGAVGASAAKYAAASFSMDVLIHLAINLVVPLIYLYIAVAIARSLFDNSLLGAAASFLRFCATTLMTVSCMAFTAYLSLSGLIAGSTDAIAVKTARTVIANGLPVVGKLMSDASSIVLAAAGLVRHSAGIYCMIAVCALCAVPFVDLFVKMLVFKAAAAASDMLPGGKLSSLIRDLGTAFGLLLGLLGSCSIMLFIAIVSGIKVLV